MEKLVENLKARNYSVRYFKTAQQARTALLKAAEEAQTIGVGGSVTIQSLDVAEELQKAGKTVRWHWLPQADGADARREAMNADLYLCSANAVTEAGQLLFIDGTGNRVAAVCYGPKKVILVVGSNKLVKDTEEAMTRIRRDACVPNAKRLGLKTPCALADTCTDCRSPGRMCNAFLTLERKPGSHPVEVWLVGEALGY